MPVVSPWPTIEQRNTVRYQVEDCAFTLAHGKVEDACWLWVTLRDLQLYQRRFGVQTVLTAACLDTSLSAKSR